MLRIAGQDLDPKLVVLDKDGTLITFDTLWHAWFNAWQAALGARIPMDDVLRGAISETLGVDSTSGVWDPLGPLTLASTTEVGLLLAGLLYRYHGTPWSEALGVVEGAERVARTHIGTHDLVQPIGDVRGLLQRFHDAGLRVALVTTDERFSTEQSLESLGLISLIDTMVCGSDGIPLKPAPDAGLEVCRRMGVSPAAAIMVGDTIADMAMARRAGFAWAVGVTSGALSGEALASYADMVIPSIHAIEIVAGSDGHVKGEFRA